MTITPRQILECAIKSYLKVALENEYPGYRDLPESTKEEVVSDAMWHVDMLDDVVDAIYGNIALEEVKQLVAKAIKEDI